MSAKTIFLSHSSKDINKVRKIRDVLETLEYDPLIFHLKCLDDNNENLEDFIKKEIDARNIFVYCKSRNAQSSVWVQKELDYIKNSSDRRLYEIDIERPLSETLVSFLHTLAEIVKKNKIFISCAHKDRLISDIVAFHLKKNGYDIIRYDSYDSNEYEKHDEDIRYISENGIFLPIITMNYINSIFCMSEIEKILYNDTSHQVIFKPVYVNILPTVAEAHFPSSAKKYVAYNLGNIECMNTNDIKGLLKFIEYDNRLR